jgi:uncharacterized protein (TIGR02246 family)
MQDDPASIHIIFEQAFNASDIDSLVALYEPNAVLLVKGQPVEGLQAIRAAYQTLLTRRSRMTLHTRSVVRFDDRLALLHADWVLEATAPDETGKTARGMSTEVVRRQENGSWRFILDNPNTPQPAR